jgi:hypothetical protein
MIYFPYFVYQRNHHGVAGVNGCVPPIFSRTRIQSLPLQRLAQLVAWTARRQK